MHGDLEWSRTYGDVNTEIPRSVVQTTDGGFAIAGWTNSYGSGGDDLWLVKTDLNGDVEWNQTYGGAAADHAGSVMKTNDAGYALVGSTKSYGAGGDDFWLVKTDPSGHIQWNRTYGDAEEDRAISAIISSDGGYVMTGYTQSFGAGDRDFWLVETDVDGDIQRSRLYGGIASDMASAIVRTIDDEYAIVGYSYSYSSGKSDFWLVLPREIDSNFRN